MAYLLFQFYVGVEHCHLIALVESQRVPLAFLVVHDVVKGSLDGREVLFLGRVR